MNFGYDLLNGKVGVEELAVSTIHFVIKWKPGINFFDSDMLRSEQELCALILPYIISW